MPRPIRLSLTQFASNRVQNPASYGSISGRKASKANCVNRSYGAGDGNRTHVRNLGSCRHPASETYRNGRTKVAASVHCRPPQPFLSLQTAQEADK